MRLRERGAALESKKKGKRKNKTRWRGREGKGITEWKQWRGKNPSCFPYVEQDGGKVIAIAFLESNKMCLICKVVDLKFQDRH